MVFQVDRITPPPPPPPPPVQTFDARPHWQSNKPTHLQVCSVTLVVQ